MEKKHPIYRKIENCRICGNTRLVELLDLGVQVLTGVFPKTRSDSIGRGPLKLVKCEGMDGACGLLQLQHSYDPKLLYGENYGYRSGLNVTMVEHLQKKVRGLLRRFAPEKGAVIIDIGSNDGTTLGAYPPDYYMCVGIDPTAEKFERFYPPKVTLIPEFFCAERVYEHLGKRRAAIVTSLAMFYDLEEPLAFMRQVSDILDRNGIWASEQSYMPAMVKNGAFDTVCHEHLEYYALDQIKWMADRSGLKLIDVEFNDVNGGSIAILMAKSESEHSVSDRVDQVLAMERRECFDSLQPFEGFSRKVVRSREALTEFLESAVHRGQRVEALGASTKGNVLLQYCGITEKNVAKVGETNSDKIGCFTPGSLIPIVTEEEVLGDMPDYLMILPWHFRAFFKTHRRFSGKTLLFPLPDLEVIRCA